MTQFNPFNKPLDDLTKEDLNILIDREVVEGFYVEYKSEFTKPDKIAKSIASFANTYGGWYFIGIKSNETTNAAETICGFDHTQVNSPIDKLMNPIRDYLSHMPLVFSKMVEISATHSVLIVQIPEGKETPYIRKDGKIYRRKADASDPIAETDRYTIDKLVNRGREEEERFRKFCEDSRTFAQNENDAWVNVYMQPQPRGLIHIDKLVSYSKLIEWIKMSQENYMEYTDEDGKVILSGNVPFNSGYFIGNSIILKQVASNNSILNHLSLQIFSDGAAILHLPIQRLNIIHNTTNIDIDTFLFLKKSLDAGFEDLAYIKFIHFGKAFLACIHLIEFYKQVTQLADYPVSIMTRVSMENVWRTVPIMESEAWIEYVKEYGFPINQFDTIMLPRLSEKSAILNSQQVNSLAYHIGWLLLMCAGMPLDAPFVGDALTKLLNVKPKN